MAKLTSSPSILKAIPMPGLQPLKIVAAHRIIHRQEASSKATEHSLRELSGDSSCTLAKNDLKPLAVRIHHFGAEVNFPSANTGFCII